MEIDASLLLIENRFLVFGHIKHQYNFLTIFDLDADQMETYPQNTAPWPRQYIPPYFLDILDLLARIDRPVVGHILFHVPEMF